ncbi:MAG: hypothetical protein GY869_02195 [Planctomycetes bacterium]|nr:hypothetical protein [Planctomycetota bacterium]
MNKIWVEMGFAVGTGSGYIVGVLGRSEYQVNGIIYGRTDEGQRLWGVDEGDGGGV